MIGFRKLTAWLLVFGLCAAVAIRTVWIDHATDIPQITADLLKWATGFFFGFNVADKLTDKYTLTKDGLQDSQPKP